MKCRYSTFFIYIFTIGASHFRMFLQHVEQFFPRREHHARRAERLHPVIPHPCKSIDKGRTLHTPYGTKIA